MRGCGALGTDDYERWWDGEAQKRVVALDADGSRAEQRADAEAQQQITREKGGEHGCEKPPPPEPPTFEEHVFEHVVECGEVAVAVVGAAQGDGGDDGDEARERAGEGSEEPGEQQGKGCTVGSADKASAARVIEAIEFGEGTPDSAGQKAHSLGSRRGGISGDVERTLAIHDIVDSCVEAGKRESGDVKRGVFGALVVNLVATDAVEQEGAA